MARIIREASELNFNSEGPQVNDENATRAYSEEVADALFHQKRAIHVQYIFDLKERRKGVKQDRKERRKYARSVFNVICCWLCSVFAVLLLNGAHHISLSDAVLITLITTTTASVITMFIYVMMYLFKNNVNLLDKVEKKSHRSDFQ